MRVQAPQCAARPARRRRGAAPRAQEHLDFYGASPRREADITDAGARALAGLTRLRSLNLAAHAGLTSEGLAFLAACRQLTALDLSSAPPSRARAPQPRLLPDPNPNHALSARAGTPLWVGGVGFLAGLTALRCLALDRTHLAPAQLAALTGLTGLTSLALADTALDDGSAGALAGLTALRALDVSFTPLRSGGAGAPAAPPPPPARPARRGRESRSPPRRRGGAAALAAAMPALAVLNLDGCGVSSLGVWRVLRLRRGLRMWPRDQEALPRPLNVLTALMVAVPAPDHRRLRVLHCPEASWPATAGVAGLTGLFFLAHVGLLLALVAALALLPLAAAAAAAVALAALASGRATLAGMRRRRRGAGAAVAALLAGGPPPAPGSPAPGHLV